MVIYIGLLVWDLLRADSIVLAHLLQLFLGTRGTGEGRIEVPQELSQARGRVPLRVNSNIHNLDTRGRRPELAHSRREGVQCDRTDSRTGRVTECEKHYLAVISVEIQRLAIRALQ